MKYFISKQKSIVDMIYRQATVTDTAVPNIKDVQTESCKITGMDTNKVTITDGIDVDDARLKRMRRECGKMTYEQIIKVA